MSITACRIANGSESRFTSDSALHPGVAEVRSYWSATKVAGTERTLLPKRHMTCAHRADRLCPIQSAGTGSRIGTHIGRVHD